MYLEPEQNCRVQWTQMFKIFLVKYLPQNHVFFTKNIEPNLKCKNS